MTSIDLDRLAQPLDGHRAKRIDLNALLAQPERVPCHERGAGPRELLHPGRQMGRLPDGGIVHAEIAPNGAHDDLARVQADPDLDVEALRAPQVPGVPTDGSLHLQRRIASAHPMVLVGDGRAEECHDPIAHDLVDSALVTMDGLHHQLEHWIKNLTGFLGIAAGEQLHRALQISEQDRDLLALALERGLRGQDLLGEVLGCVGLRRSELRTP